MGDYKPVRAPQKEERSHEGAGRREHARRAPAAGMSKQQWRQGCLGSEGRGRVASGGDRNNGLRWELGDVGRIADPVGTTGQEAQFEKRARGIRLTRGRQKGKEEERERGEVAKTARAVVLIWCAACPASRLAALGWGGRPTARGRRRFPKWTRRWIVYLF